MAFTQPAPSKAVLAALRDANSGFPGRKKASDGTSGDAAHVARADALIQKGGQPEGHVMGNAFDITHDPDHGVIGRAIGELALTDPRTAYVISDGEIASRTGAYAGQGWRPYSGANPHRHHVHVSINPAMRNDDSLWPWAHGMPPDFVNADGAGIPQSVKTVALVSSVTTAAYFIGKALFKW